MSSAEFSMWLEMYESDPWDEHMDLGFGMVAATVANYAGKARIAGVPNAIPSDYMPLPVPPVIEPDPVEFFSRL